MEKFGDHQFKSNPLMFKVLEPTKKIESLGCQCTYSSMPLPSQDLNIKTKYKKTYQVLWNASLKSRTHFGYLKQQTKKILLLCYRIKGRKYRLAAHKHYHRSPDTQTKFNCIVASPSKSLWIVQIINCDYFLSYSNISFLENQSIFQEK